MTGGSAHLFRFRLNACDFDVHLFAVLDRVAKHASDKMCDNSNTRTVFASTRCGTSIFKLVWILHIQNQSAEGTKMTHCFRNV